MKDTTKNWGDANQTNVLPSKVWALLPYFLLGIACASLITLSNIEFSISIDWADQEKTFYSLNQALSVIPESIWSNLTQLGDAAVLIPILALVLVSRPNVWITIVYAAPIAGIVCQFMKRFFETPRPGAMLEPGSYIQIGELPEGRNSFPSGHTSTVFVAIIAILCTCYPSASDRSQKTIIGLGLLLAFTIGLSRVAVGAHWPLDVILGAGIGAASAIIGAKLAVNHSNNWARKPAIQIFGICIPAILSVILFYRIASGGESDLVVLIAMVSGLIASTSLMKRRLVRMGNN